MEDPIIDAGDGRRVLNPEIVAFNQRSAAKSAKIAKMLEDPIVKSVAITEFNAEISRLSCLTDQWDSPFGLRQLSSFTSTIIALEPFHAELVTHRSKTIKLVSAQSRRAQKLRILLEGIPLRDRIDALTLKPEMRDQTTKALWPHFICMIREFGSVITESWSDKECGDWLIEFEYDRHLSSPKGAQAPHTMTYKRFRTIVNDVRKRARYPG